MAFRNWLIIISLAVLIIFIILALGFYFQKKPIKNASVDAAIEIIKDRSYWSNFRQGPNTNKNICSLYTFPTTRINGNISIPVPTLNSTILDQLTGVTLPKPIKCIDSDQIAAQQVTRICIGPKEESVYHDLITLCTTQNGDIVPLSESETLYTSYPVPIIGTCPYIAQCAGKLSVISMAHNLNQGNLVCIKKISDTDLIIANCNPADTSQLFRVTRIDPGQNPSSLVPGKGQNGIISQIFDRNNNTCMKVGTTNTQTTLNLTGRTLTLTGTNVIFGECVKNNTLGLLAFEGYDWVFLPGSEYCNSTSCTVNCPNPNICGTVNNDSKCVKINSQPGTCTGSAFINVPPQMIYTGNLDFTNAPILNTKIKTYQNLTGYNALLKWLIDNGALTLIYGGNLPSSGTKPILFRMSSLDYSDPELLNYLSNQYIGLELYNFISEYSVCTTSAPINIASNCYPL